MTFLPFNDAIEVFEQCSNNNHSFNFSNPLHVGYRHDFSSRTHKMGGEEARSRIYVQLLFELGHPYLESVMS